jgi:DnaJ-class molecular chaperone
VRRGQAVEITALQRSYRKLARMVHPDLNQHDGEATRCAQQRNADYERAMELIGVVSPNQEV